MRFVSSFTSLVVLVMVASSLTAAFKTLKSSSFPGFGPNMVNKNQGTVKESSKERRKTKERITKVENKLDELLKKSKSLKKTDDSTKVKVGEMTNRLQGIESSLSSVALLNSSLNQVSKRSQRHEEAVSELKAAEVANKQHISNIESKIGSLSAEIQKTQAMLSSKGDATNADSTCPPEFNFVKETNQCLMLATAAQASERERICSKLHKNARPAVVDTTQKLKGAQMYLKGQDPGHSVHVGAKRDESLSDVKYRWFNENPVSSDPGWCPGEPHAKKCVALWEARGFCLDDTDCSRIHPILCEIIIEKSK